MSVRRKKNVCGAKNNKINGYIISAINKDSSESVKKLVFLRALSRCKDSHEGYVLLCSAIQSGYIKGAEFLLQKLLPEKNAAINSVINSRKETPLHVAAKKGCAEIVRVLLDNNASVTAQTIEGLTPLLSAAEGGHEEIVQMLFEHACVNVKDLKDSLPPVFFMENRSKTLLLLTAIKNEHIKHINESIKLFLNSGFDANAKDEKGKTCLHYLVDRVEIIKLSVDAEFDVNAKDEKGKMCYFLNCEEEDKCVEIMQLLFANGANIKMTNELLHTAVNKRLIKVCKVLIENGVDVNEENTNGSTPLHLAVCDWEKLEEKRKITEAIGNDIIKLLLNNGANVSIKANDGFTAFHHAVILGRKETIRIFVNHGVNIDLRSEDDSTPLLLACKKGLTKTVKFFCKNGANVDACQKNGCTPLHQAAHNLKDDVVRILLDNGCDINAETIDTDTALSFAISQAKSDYAKEKGQVYYRHHRFVDCLFDDDDDDDFGLFDDDDYFGLFDDHNGVDNIDAYFNANEYDYVVTLKQHVLKLKVAGLHVSQNNLDLLKFSGSGNLTFEQECVEEVSRVASKKLSSEFLLCDILKTDKNLTLARTKYLVRNLESFRFEEFPIYGSLLRNKFEKSKFRLELSILGQKSLDILVKASSRCNGRKCTVLPVELLELIVSFLNISDLRSLISCGNARKRQRNQ